MTIDDAMKWAAIMLTVDNGCPNCIRNVVAQANKRFPGFEFIYDEDVNPYPGIITVSKVKSK